MSTTIDIVLPCYNPNASWYKELLAFYEQAKSLNATVRFVVVNDGSVSGKVEQQIQALHAQGLMLEYISYARNMGKGYALRQGVRASPAEYLVYTDIDFPFTNASMLEVINALLSDRYDVVVGYRAQEYYQNKMSGFRRLLSQLFRFFLKNILKMPITDTQCGLKAFNRKGRQTFLDTRINRYLFDFEFIYSACTDQQVRIHTVAVQLKDNVVFSKMRLKILLQESLNLMSVLVFRRRPPATKTNA